MNHFYDHDAEDNDIDKGNGNDNNSTDQRVNSNDKMNLVIMI